MASESVSSEEYEQILHQATQAWGKEPQLDCLAEECAEVIDALMKLKRGRVSPETVMWELVDVQVMLDQARNLLDPTGEEWAKAREYKVRRLSERLQGVIQDGQ